MDPTAFLSLNHNTGRGSMSNQYTQTTTHQPWTDLCPVFSSLRPMDSKRKRLRVSNAFFKKFFLPEGRMTETVATVEQVCDLWEPGAMDEVPPIFDEL